MKLKSLAVAVALVSGNGFAADVVVSGSLEVSMAATPESIYIISQGNDSIQRIDLDSETASTVKELDFYSQGEAVYDSIGGSLYLLNPSVTPKKVISYDLTAGTSDELSIANDDGPVLSLFGINSEANVFVLTDRFEDLGETDAEAKRFAKVDTEGALTRLGTTLPAGSIFPQGRQLYNELNNTVYTIANDQSKKLIAMNLANNSVESASTTASTLIGFTADGNIIGLVTGTADPKILSINLETGEETTLVSGVPTGGYDNFARGYVDLANDRVVMMLGGQATDSFTGSGIASYSLSTGELIKTYETEGQGRFVVTSLLKKVDTGTETFSTDIDAPLATLVKLGDGELVLTGTNSSEGGVVVDAGILEVAGSDQLGTGTVVLSGGELELSADGTVTNVIQSEDDTSSIDVGENDVVASGEVNGSSKLTKIGSGELELTGDLTNTGGIEVDEGTLVVNGEGTTSVTVDSGTLGGAGTIGDLIVSGSVAPGNSIGTLNVSGDVTLASGSTFIVEIDADGNTDKLIATGDVTIDGELQISAASGTYDNQTYVFLTGGSLTGEFSEVSITGCSATPSVTIGDTQASFVIVSCSSSNSSNDDAVISYINDLQSGASGDLATVLTAINALSGTDYSAAVAQLDHDGAAASIASVGQVASAAGASVSSRVSTVSASSPDASTFALMMADDGQQAIDIDSKKALLSQRGWWINLFGGSLDADERSSLGINGYKNDYAGTTLGYDVPNSEGGLNGFAITYSSGQVDADGSAGSTDYSSVILSPYYSARTANGGITTVYGHIGSSSNDGRRNISIGAIDRVAMSSYDSLTYGVGIEHQEGVRKIDGRFHTTRYGASLSAINVDGFTETGADSLNLEVDEMSQTIASVGFGHRIHWEYNNGDYKQMPFVDFGMDYLSFLEDQKASQALSGQSKFTTTAGEDSELNGSFGTGVVMRSDVDQFSFGVRYKIAEYYQDVSGSLEYKRFF